MFYFLNITVEECETSCVPRKWESFGWRDFLFVMQSLIIYKKIRKEKTFTQYLLCETLLDVLNKVFNSKKLQYNHKKYNVCRAQQFFKKVNRPMVNLRSRVTLSIILTQRFLLVTGSQRETSNITDKSSLFLKFVWKGSHSIYSSVSWPFFSNLFVSLS